jgi:hypothetical protein
MKPLLVPEADDLPGGLFDPLLPKFGVAEDQLGAATSFLRSLVTTARRDHAVDQLRKEVKRLGLAKKAAALHAGIAKLSDEARAALGPNLDLMNETIDDIMRVGADAPLPKAFGEVPTKKPKAFDNLVAALYAMEMDEGWNISVEPEARTGTLVTFLNLVRPYLPADFFPRGLWVDRDEYVKGSPNPWNRLKRWGTAIHKWPPGSVAAKGTGEARDRALKRKDGPWNRTGER